MNHRSPVGSAPPAGCTIASHAFVESRLSGLAALRNGPAGEPALPPRFLRHADEHTVVGVHAVITAIARGPDCGDRSGHAVVAAPCQSGRLAAAHALAQLASGGAVTVSPHIVPQCSMHSLAGAVSVALGMHGPHLGVGGGPEALAEGLFAAATLLTTAPSTCTAAWLVATEWDDEPTLDATGAATGDPVCRALAVWLTPASAGERGSEDGPLSLNLRIPPASGRVGRPLATKGGLVALSRALAMCEEGGALTAWTVTCPWGAELRFAVRCPVATWREAA
ncbi:MAG: hypothetical protein FJ284_08805 [Planctomycetes bacterium]|nr:hypothetical protein [Planctomycetota bacterium]